MAIQETVVFLRFLTPLALGWLAWVVARGPHQERSSRLLALFLGLVAAGFAIEAVWDLIRPEAAQPNKFLRTLQYYVGLVDPPVLLCFALMYGRERRPRNLSLLWACYALAGFVLAYAQFGASDPWTSRYIATQWFEIVYVNGTYLWATLILLGQVRSETRRYMAHHVHYLALGIGFAALSRSAAIYWSGGPVSASLDEPFQQPVAALLGLATALALLAVLLAAVGFSGTPARKSLRPIGLSMAALLATFFLALVGLWYLGLALWTGPPSLAAYFYGYRWLVFGAIVAYAMLRFRLFDFELRARQAFKILGAFAVGLAGAVAITETSMANGLGIVEARLLGAIGGLVLAAVAVPLLSPLARWLAPDPKTADEVRARSVEIYEAALEVAARKPEWTEADRRYVETLRSVFGISAAEHEAMLDRARRVQSTTREKRIDAG